MRASLLCARGWPEGEERAGILLCARGWLQWVRSLPASPARCGCSEPRHLVPLSVQGARWGREDGIWGDSSRNM